MQKLRKRWTLRDPNTLLGLSERRAQAEPCESRDKPDCLSWVVVKIVGPFGSL